MAPKKKNSENIRVVVRCRHLLSFEAERGDKLAVTVDLATNQVLVKHAIGEPDVKAFDAVFDNSFTQRQIFVQEVKPLVDSVLQGYNATVFAYGQSGSGKTFTMTGDLESKDPAKYGMMPQVVDHLFSEITRLTSATKQYKVRVSYIELYNGKTRDLLSDRQVPLDIKENLAKNFYVKGAESPEVMNWGECMAQFDHGTHRRRTASTDLNEHSSRSHSLFTLQVEQHDFEQDPQAPVIITSKINVVDHAGSERLGKTNATGETMVEGCNINLSLSQLATVIDTIVKGAKHIPYRSGPLTMLLKDSLGGNSKTVMFANVSPSDKNTAETISTLRFAERAKQIENKPIKNLDPKDARIQELLDKIEELQKRLGGAGDLDGEEKLRERITELEAENDQLRVNGGVDTIAMEEASRQLQLQVQQANEKIKARDAEFAALQQEKDIMQSNLRTDLASANELRSISTSFLKRLMTEQQLQMIAKSMPQSIVHSTDGTWDVSEISCYMDGYVQLHEAWRKTALTQDDVAREAARVRAEVERQLGAQVQLLETEKTALLKQRDEERRSQNANTEATSQVRVEAENAREENKKLREKIERDQEKFKKKLDKSKEEQTAVQVELDALKTEMSSKTREADRLKKQLEDANNLAATASEMVRGASPTRSDTVAGGGSEAVRQVQELQKELERVQQAKDAVESRNRVLNLQLRRGAVWQLPDGAVAPPPPPPDGEDADMQNDAFVIPADLDGDLIGVLQQQVRIQHRLQELHHTHQKKLDVMLKKFELVRTGSVTSIDKAAAVVAAVAASNPAVAGGAAAGAAAGGSGVAAGGHHHYGGGVPDAAVQERILEAVRSKQEELDALRVETDKTMDKLVRKMNKRVSEFEQREKELKDDLAALTEERDEAAAHADDLTRFNGQLALEVENLRAKLEARGREATEDATLRESETAHLRLVVAQLEHALESARSKGDQYDQLQDEYQRLQATLHRMENTMQEKLADLENSRQMIKWNNSLLEAEKKRTEEAEIRLRDQELAFRDVEEQWRRKVHEHGQNIAAQQTSRLEQQAEHYQHLLEEEAARTKDVKDKLKSAKQKTAKAAQRYDEMVFENEVLQNQFEELKFNSMKALRDQNRASVTNESDMIRNMIRGQQRDYDAMGGAGGRRGW